MRRGSWVFRQAARRTSPKEKEEGRGGEEERRIGGEEKEGWKRAYLDLMRSPSGSIVYRSTSRADTITSPTRNTSHAPQTCQ